MAKYCNVCRQTYSVEYSSCPFCEVPALLDRSRPRQPVSANAPAEQIEPPVESSAPGENGGPCPIGPAQMLLSQPGPQANGSESPNDESRGEIDLGSPVLLGRGDDAGPPSGASFVSWGSLVGNRKDSGDGRPAKPGDTGPSARALLGSPAATDGAKSATKFPAAPARTSAWFYVAAVPIGVLLAILIKLLLLR